MNAVILAAGKGTRMREITRTIPKPMVPVRGKPMLEHLLLRIRDAGITDFGIVVGYMKETITDHFGDGSSYGVSIQYIEQLEQNGTGAALDTARDYPGDNPFFFTFGDILTHEENYRGMMKYFTHNSCDALLALNEVEDPHKGAAVYINDENTIVRMVEKPPKGTSTTNLTNAGIMILRPDVFEYTSRLTLSPRGEYELTDVFGMLNDDGKILKGYVLSGYWRDVGTPEDLADMQNIQ